MSKVHRFYNTELREFAAKHMTLKDAQILCESGALLNEDEQALKNAAFDIIADEASRIRNRILGKYLTSKSLK